MAKGGVEQCVVRSMLRRVKGLFQFWRVEYADKLRYRIGRGEFDGGGRQCELHRATVKRAARLGLI